jgi:hypothetical protein
VPVAAEPSQDINARLIGAARNGELEEVRRWLDHGADIHAGGNYALHMAAGYGHVETVALLLKHGAKIHAEDDQALCCAAENGHTETVALLLAHGANIHAGDDRALHYAAEGGHGETVALLEAGESLATLASESSPGLVYGSAAIAARLGFAGEELTGFARQSVAGPEAGNREEKLGLRPYLEAGGVRDMAVETAEAILLPQLLLDAGLASKPPLSEVTDEQISRWTKRLLPLAGQLLLHGKSLEGMLALSKEWHIAGNALPDRLRLLRGGRWHAVLPEIETPVMYRTQDGEELPVTVKALASQEELKRESDQLKHCVGTAGYGTQCSEGTTHILSFQAGGQSLATMEVSIGQDRKAPLVNKQFHGSSNGPPPKAAEAAWQWLKEQLASGNQKLNPEPEQGWGKIELPDSPPPAVGTIGYWPEEMQVNRCYRHLQERLKLKEETARENRREGAFWTSRVEEKGYRWWQALIPIREGFNGILKENNERSGLHEVIEKAGIAPAWDALVHELRPRSAARPRAVRRHDQARFSGSSPSL